MSDKHIVYEVVIRKTVTREIRIAYAAQTGLRNNVTDIPGMSLEKATELALAREEVRKGTGWVTVNESEPVVAEVITTHRPAPMVRKRRR
jgi:hypothetical protein